MPFLRQPTSQHVVVGIVRDGVDVRRRLGAAFALVGGHHGGRVDRQPFVRVHRHTEEAGVGLGEGTVSPDRSGLKVGGGGGGLT